MTEFTTVDDFLNYRPQETGGGGRRLGSWHKDPGFLNWWMHTKRFPCAVWYHRVPELVVRQDKNDPQKTLRNVWGRQHACWEDESILKKQYFRLSDGTREHPPLKCGLCRCQECVRQMILSGALKDTQEVFKWDGSDKPDENKILHAGGACSFWKRDGMDEETKKRLAAAGIYFAWLPNRPGVSSESMIAQMNYIFTGANHDALDKGVQVAVMKKDVGEKVQRTINKEIASNDGDKGNPFVQPYCIQLVYNAAEKEFGKKYDALRMNRFAMTPEIERLIKGEPPNISKYLEKFNQDTLRCQLQNACLVDLPWDNIFDVPVKIPGGSTAKSDQAPPVQPPGPKTTVQVPADVGAKAEEWGDPCDDCKAPMKKDQTKCAKCGAVYEVEAATAATAPAQAATSAPPPATGESTEALYDDDEVPF